MTKAIYVWCWFIFLPHICPFLKKILLYDISLTM